MTASGLPKGMSLVRVDGSAGGLALPGLAVWGFQGFTTKAGTYLVTVKATLNGKTVTQRLALEVEGLPSWAKGTFNGYASSTGGSPVQGTSITGGSSVQGGEENAQAARSTNGLATVTISSAGKISGKFQEHGTNWTLSAACYTDGRARSRGCLSTLRVRLRRIFPPKGFAFLRRMSGPQSQAGGSQNNVDAVASARRPYQFTCTNVIAKYAYKVTEKDKKGKKKTVTKSITRTFTFAVSSVPVVPDVADVPVRGLATLTETGGSQSSATEITAYQNLWGSTYKEVGKKLFTTKSKKKTLAYKTFTIKGTDEDGVQLGLGEGDTLTLKITTKGVVTATYKFDTGRTAKNKKTKKVEPVYYSAKCSTVVIPTSAPDAEEFTGEVILYFAPNEKNGFQGYISCAPLWAGRLTQ